MFAIHLEVVVYFLGTIILCGPNFLNPTMRLAFPYTGKKSMSMCTHGIRMLRDGAVDKLGNLDFSPGIWYNKRKNGCEV